MGSSVMEEEEVKFEIVKKIIGIDPLTVSCTFCLAEIGQQCKSGLYQPINMPHSTRWKTRINIDKPVVKKNYRITAEIRETKLVGEFQAISSYEAIKAARLCVNDQTAVHEFFAEEI